jgi:hypothetical protein
MFTMIYLQYYRDEWLQLWISTEDIQMAAELCFMFTSTSACILSATRQLPKTCDSDTTAIQIEKYKTFHSLVLVLTKQVFDRIPRVTDVSYVRISHYYSKVFK